MSTDVGSQSPKKRLRVTTGCLTCRKRHVKCDEGRPTCKNCAKKNRPCSYDEAADREHESLPSIGAIGTAEAIGVTIPDARLPRASVDSPSASITTANPLSPAARYPLAPPSVGAGREIHGASGTASHAPTPASSSIADGYAEGNRDRTWMTTFLRDDVQADGHSSIGPSQEPLTSASPASSSLSTDLATVLRRADLETLQTESEIQPVSSVNSRPAAPDLRAHLDYAPSYKGLHLFPNIPYHSQGVLQAPFDVFRVNMPMRIEGAEATMFRNYVEQLSRWVDACSPDRPFCLIVPTLALYCPALLLSCFAVSSKQLTLLASMGDSRMPEGAVMHVHYYRQALKAVSSLLANPEYAQSDEVLAACVLLSTYEALDVGEQNISSHLEGISFLLRSRQVHGDSRGIRGATYWTWYRQEIWAALYTGGTMALEGHEWQPEPLASFEHLSIEEIASRSIFLFGQFVNFCNEEGRTNAGGMMTDVERAQQRQAKAMMLRDQLEDWKEKLPLSMSSCFSEEPKRKYHEGRAPEQIPSLWFIYPQAAISHQIYHACRILLSLHYPHLALSPHPSTTSTPGSLGHGQGHSHASPSPNASVSTSTLPSPGALPTAGPTLSHSLTVRRNIERSRAQIALVASSDLPDNWSFISAQCLYIAGLVTEGAQERRRTLEVIEDCQRRSGRKTIYVADELRRMWA